MVSNEVLIAAIGAATTIISAFLAYLTAKVSHVTKLVNSAASLLAEQTRQDTLAAQERTDKLVKEAKEDKRPQGQEEHNG